MLDVSDLKRCLVGRTFDFDFLWRVVNLIALNGRETSAPNTTRVHGPNVFLTHGAEGGPMSKCDSCANGLAMGNLEPWHIAFGCFGAVFLDLKVHMAGGRAKAQSGEGIESAAQPVHALQARVPLGWFIAVHVHEKFGSIGPAQNAFNFMC